MDKRDLEQLLSDVAGGAVTPAVALTRIQTLRPPIWALRSSIFRAGCAREPARLSTVPVKPPIRLPPLSKRCAMPARSASWSRAWTPKRPPAPRSFSQRHRPGICPGRAARPRGRQALPYRQRTHRCRLRRHERPARRRGSRVDGRVLWQRSRPPYDVASPDCTACLRMLRNLPGRRWSSPSPAWKAPWRASSAAGELPGHRRSHQRGYGANFGGVAALLAMLNSCASGVSVVNIDNGFGAAYQASLINHLSAGTPCAR